MSEGAMDRKRRTGQGTRPRRITAYPLVIGAALVGAVALIKVFEFSLEAPWDALLIDRDRGTYPLTVQNVMWVVFMLGLGELFVRWREAQAEMRQLRAGYLPEDETTDPARRRSLRRRSMRPRARDRRAPTRQRRAPQPFSAPADPTGRRPSSRPTGRSSKPARHVSTPAWTCSCTRSTCATP